MPGNARAAPAARRRHGVLLGLIGLLVVTSIAAIDIAWIGAGSGTTGIRAALARTMPSPAVNRSTARPPVPWFGLLEAQSDQLTALAHGHVLTDIVVPASWDELEPTGDVLDTDAADALRNRVRAVRALGYRVVLDLGLQYPPSWVFQLPGQTRFVDQYGDVWHGGLSADVPNAVYNTSVRAAEAHYIARLGTLLRGSHIARVRVGGLLSGELRYPPATYNGHSDLIWNYDAAAQSSSPIPGWRPGVGTAQDAHTALDYYFSSLTRYLTLSMDAIRHSFPDQTQEILFPSWGLRPGMVDTAIAAGLRNTTDAEVNGMLSSGLDWTEQVAAVARTRIPALLSCTWLDAPSQGTTIQQVPPIAFLTQLAKPYGFGVTAENTGGGGVQALRLSIDRVKAYHLRGMLYQSGRFIEQGSAGISMATLINAASGAQH